MIVGLKIQKKWIDLILNGTKKWEIRHFNYKKQINKKIHLCQTGTNFIIGYVTMEECLPVSKKQLKSKIAKQMHCMTEKEIDNLKYTNPHVWSFKKPHRYKKKRLFVNKQGAELLINIDEKEIKIVN